MPVESRMNRNVHVRFGGAGRGNGPSVRAALRPGSTLPYTARVCLLWRKPRKHHYAAAPIMWPCLSPWLVEGVNEPAGYA